MLMISKTTRNTINSAITQELNQAHKAHGRRFATPHEGYGVLMEEIWEARLHTTAIDGLSEQLIGLLHSVETHPEAYSKQLGRIKEQAVAAIEELCQVAAMCEKGMRSIQGGHNDER